MLIVPFPNKELTITCHFFNNFLIFFLLLPIFRLEYFIIKIVITALPYAKASLLEF